MVDLHAAATPNGRKTHIMLEETGLPGRTRWIGIDRGDRFDPGLLRISPDDKVPVIVDRDGPGGREAAIFGSGAKAGDASRRLTHRGA